jgi:translation initiation factor IF-3
VRVVDEEGGQVGIMRTLDALDLARSKGLDLVEVAPKGRPPVCRIMNYGKYLYQQSKREHAARKKQRSFSVKEIKLRPKTGEHDYLFKVRHIETFLSKLNKVKVTILFRGRERTHPEIGEKILHRIAAHFGDRVIVEQQPRFEGHNMTMVLTPGNYYKEADKS